MWILGLDCSTLIASVAIVRDRAVVAALDVTTTTHSDVLLAAIDDVVRAAALVPAGLDAVAIGAGPGSFTGVRIGMATAKGIAFAVDVPLYLVSSLAALAADAAAGGADGLIVPAMDARRGEIYAGFYARDASGVRAVSPDRVATPTEIAGLIGEFAGDRPATVVGDAIAAYPLAFPPPMVSVHHLRRTPSGASVAQLTASGTVHDALIEGAPRYIRPAEAEIKYPNGVPGALRKA